MAKEQPSTDREEGRDDLMDADEISNIEEGFAESYDHEQTQVKCQNCEKMILDTAVEREFRGQEYFFCSINCAEMYIKKLKSA